MHKLVLKSLLIFSLISVLFSCGNSKDRTEDVDLSEVKEVKVEISRYEQALFSMNPDNIEIEIKEVANEFPQFLQGDLSDSLNIMQLHDFISDPTILRLYEDCQNVFPTVKNLEKELQTTHDKLIPLKGEMLGTAEIITKKHSLLNRIMNRLLHW